MKELEERRWMRHGDVFLVEVKEIPATAKVKEDGILAEGEQTGHHHRVVSGAVVMEGFDEQLYVDVKDDIAKIVHQQHGDKVGNPIYRFKDIPHGKYRVGIKRQHRYGKSVRVMD